MYLTTIREKAAESKSLSSRDFALERDAETISRDKRDLYM